MINTTKHRENGAKGALLDEYERAIKELIRTIENLTKEELQLIVNHRTNDKDCRSIQTILTHVINSGYTYVIEMRKWLGEELDHNEKKAFNSVEEYTSDMVKMFEFTEAFFNDYPNLKLTELDLSLKIKVKWGQMFDIEQLMEHAILHILRHRRQIEIIKLQFKS